MKSKEIKELETKDLAEKLETEVARYNQMKLNHAISMKTELRQRELNK